MCILRSPLQSSYLKAAVLQNILKKSLVTNTDNALFCHRDIPTIHNGYCVSNAVDYAKKNYVLPMILSTEGSV